ncbi:hypothetical protein Unana1_08368 [Umbelopsis nana]
MQPVHRWPCDCAQLVDFISIVARSRYHSAYTEATERYLFRERMNSTIKQALLKLALDHNNVNNWDNYLEQALLAIRTMPNESNGFTPARLLYGYDIRTPALWPALRETMSKESTMKLWEADLMEYQFEVKYRRGPDNPANMLSRLIQQ